MTETAGPASEVTFRMLPYPRIRVPQTRETEAVERAAQPLCVLSESLSIATRNFVRATTAAVASLRAFRVAVPEQQLSREVAEGPSFELLDQLLDQVCGVERRRPAGKCHRYALFHGLTVPVESPCRPEPETYTYWADSWADAKRLEATCGNARNDPGHRCMIHRVRGGG